MQVFPATIFMDPHFVTYKLKQLRLFWQWFYDILPCDLEVSLFLSCSEWLAAPMPKTEVIQRRHWLFNKLLTQGQVQQTEMAWSKSRSLYQHWTPAPRNSYSITPFIYLFSKSYFVPACSSITHGVGKKSLKFHLVYIIVEKKDTKKIKNMISDN